MQVEVTWRPVQATNRYLPKFLVAAVLFFTWGTIQGALQAQQPIHQFIEQGPAQIIVGAHVHVGLLGWVSLPLAALAYYLVPLLTNKPIAAPGLIDWVFWAWVVSTAANGIVMITVGIRAGNAFVAGVRGPELEALMAPYMMTVGLISIVCALVALAFAVQILATVARKIPS